MNHPPIPILDLRASIQEQEEELRQALVNVLQSGAFIQGPEVKAFEEEVADYLGVRSAVGVNSGTDALILALRALGAEPGVEVITSPFTFFATAEAISVTGATPVFADIDPNSFNLDPQKVGEVLSSRTRILLPVHLFGRPADMAAMQAIAEKHELQLLEDCAQSIGAKLEGRATGSMGAAGTFSFYPTKNLGAFGDGGLVVTQSASIAEKVRKLGNHGSLERYHNEELGMNSRLDAMQAAILRVRFRKLDAWNYSRRKAAARYNQWLADVDGLQTPEISPGHVFHQYTLRILDGRRDALQAHLKSVGISTIVYYPVPLTELPVYRGQYPKFPHSEQAAAQVLSLPLWPDMPESTQQRVVDGIRSFFTNRAAAGLPR